MSHLYPCLISDHTVKNYGGCRDRSVLAYPSHCVEMRESTVLGYFAPEDRYFGTCRQKAGLSHINWFSQVYVLLQCNTCGAAPADGRVYAVSGCSPINLNTQKQISLMYLH